MNRLKSWALGVLGSSVLMALGFSSCSKKAALNNEEILDVYGPPPAEYVDSLDTPDHLESDSTVTTDKETTK